LTNCIDTSYSASMPGAPARLSPLALVILALLREEPMHPYQMQVLIRHRAKDQVVNVRQRTSLYRTIERLRADGLVAVHATERAAQRPERTVYELTGAGSDALTRGINDALAQPRDEFPEFPAAMSLIVAIDVADVIDALEHRVRALDARLAEIDAAFEFTATMNLPRVFLLEEEYVRAITRAEREWVAEIVGDLRSGRVSWNEQWLREISARFAPDSS
jgi:DNA-binding PadR family transcriptional regulator